MQKRIRRACLQLNYEAFENSSAFPKVFRRSPVPPPSGQDAPCVYIALIPFQARWLTNFEAENFFRYAVIPFVWQDPNDGGPAELDLKLLDAIDDAEEVLRDLAQSDEWNAEPALAMMDIDNIDPTPVSLAAYGLPAPLIKPPLAAARIDVRVTMQYDTQ